MLWLSKGRSDWHLQVFLACELSSLQQVKFQKSLGTWMHILN